MSTGLLTRFLSPAVLAAMAHAEQFSAPANRPADSDIHIDTIIKFICPDCDEGHDYRDDAVNCCSKNRLSGSVKQLLFTCPVCQQKCADIHDAANCCLWKDLAPMARFNIAAAVERGATWADAIAAHAVVPS